jgi:hypothetical protein
MLAPAVNRHVRYRPTDEDHIAHLMQAIAAGDRSALWTFRDVADPPVRRRLLTTLHRLDVPFDADDLDGMVTDAVLAIADVAGAWRPGGAPPWVWAHHRVVRVVHRFVGIFATSLDALADGGRGEVLARLTACGQRGIPPAPTGLILDSAQVMSDTRAALKRLAAERPDAALFDAALSETVSARDAALWLAVLDEREAGNRHPALTVGVRFGMRPEAVRKAVQRVGQRLRRATHDDRFSDLASLPLFACSGRRAAA